VPRVSPITMPVKNRATNILSRVRTRFPMPTILPRREERRNADLTRHGTMTVGYIERRRAIRRTTAFVDECAAGTAGAASIRQRRRR
jgi:hypothetical protein